MLFHWYQFLRLVLCIFMQYTNDMKILPEPVVFEWDEGNIDKNFIKHAVTSEEAEEVFINQPLIVATDLKHSALENRFHALGRTSKNRKLFVSFTIREYKVRIISIRDMNKKEVLVYDKKT